MNVNPQQVRELRERLGIGLHEAKEILVARDLRKRVIKAQGVPALREVLFDLINAILPADPGVG